MRKQNGFPQDEQKVLSRALITSIGCEGRFIVTYWIVLGLH